MSVIDTVKRGVPSTTRGWVLAGVTVLGTAAAATVATVVVRRHRS